ncbi:MAG: replication associated protein [Avonheates virus SG_479]|uniref:replication associated protein n=1 Tax=Avonheates virus SG_479 TaxID=2914485 RepID=UPI002481E357|nr:MAG: replication associated protein [Avonheates virus SG_479]UNI72634.1 MAG: replication associated protein [Avonheates virus SG_479]
MSQESVVSELTNIMELEALLDDAQSNSESLISEQFTDVSGNNMVSRALLTMFPPDQHQMWLQPETYFEPHRLNIWCGQFESCPTTDKLHVHIYCEFKRNARLRFASIRAIIEQKTGCNGNIQVPRRISKKQRQSAINYVLKPDGRLDDTEAFVWTHNKFPVAYDPSLRKKTNSKKTNLVEEQVNYIESKPKHWTWESIVHETKESKLLLASCSWGAKFHSGRYASTPRRTIKNVIVLYGAGGTGKTTIAANHDIQENEVMTERYYKRNSDDGKFWGGGRTAYKGQRIIHLEEFCGQETAANFKEICDINKNGPSVNIKNGGTELNHETVIITSNHHPAGWYRKLFKQDPKQWPPICRRFTQVWFFPEHRPNGDLNIPDNDNPPYYEDQTDFFTDKNSIMNYDAVLNHAESSWPLPQEAANPDVERLCY